MKVPLGLQYDLAFLWNTIEAVKDFDNSSIVELYESFIEIIGRAPSLSLSTYWDEKYKRPSTIIGIPQTEKGKNSSYAFFNVPALSYLKNMKKLNVKHDPLDLIHKIYETAITSLENTSVAHEREVLITACFMLSIKSGRASLLLQTLVIAMTNPFPLNLNVSILKDMYQYVQSKLGTPVVIRNNATEPLLAASISDPLVLFGFKRMEPIPGEESESIRQFGAKTRKGGMLLSFGKADHGKLGHGDVQLHRLVPTVIEALQDIDVVKMVSMSTYAIAIDSAGFAYVWGTGGSAGLSAHQQLKTDILPQVLEALPPKLYVQDVSCGLGHALFLLRGGKVYSWGNGGNGRLGLGDSLDRTEACPISSLTGIHVTSVMCGASHSMALTDLGKVYSWGKNTQGQCGLGPVEQLQEVNRPTQVKHKLENVTVKQLAAGWEHSLALSEEGRLFSWGCGYKDPRRGVVPPVLGHGNNEGKTSPEPITSIETVKIVKIICGWDHCLVLDDQGKVLSWGSGQNGKLGHNNEDNVALPTYISALESLEVMGIAAGCEHSACITSNGDMYSWGHGDGGRLGQGSNGQSFVPALVTAVRSMNVRPTFVHCGDKFTMILVAPLWMPASDGTVAVAAADSVIVEPSPGKEMAQLLKSRLLQYEWNSSGDLLSSAFHKISVPPSSSSTSSVSLYEKSLLHLREHLVKTTDKPSNEPGDASPENHSVSESEFLKMLLVLMAECAALNETEKTSAPTTIDKKFLEPGADREFSVECTDNVFISIVSLLEILLPNYCGALDAFLASHHRNESLLDQPHNHRNPVGSDRLISAFEPLHCLLTLFVSNIEGMTALKKRHANGGSLSPRSNSIRSDDMDEEEEETSGDENASEESMDDSTKYLEKDQQISESNRATAEGRQGGSGDPAVSEYPNTLRSESPFRSAHNANVQNSMDGSVASRQPYQQGEMMTSTPSNNYSSGGGGNNRYRDEEEDTRSAYDTEYYYNRGGDSNDDDDSLFSRGNRGRNNSCRSGGSRTEYSTYDDHELYDSDGRSNMDYHDESFRTGDDEDNSHYSSPMRHSRRRHHDSSYDVENSPAARSYTNTPPHDGGGEEEPHEGNLMEHYQRGVGYEEEEEGEPSGAMYEQDVINVDMQRAIISSMVESDIPYNAFDYETGGGGKESSPNGGASAVVSAAGSIAKTRDLVNSISSQCFIALENLAALKSLKADVSASNQAELLAGVQSLYQIWETSQVITYKGFEALYCLADQRTVLCQVVQSPSSFLYIIPGLVSGILGDSSASSIAGLDEQDDGSFSLIHSTLPECHVLLSSGNSAVSDTNDSNYSSDCLYVNDVLNLLLFIKTEIAAARDTAVVQGSLKNADQSFGIMYVHVTSSLIRLFGALLTVLLTVLDSFQRTNVVLISELRHEYQLSPHLPWGPRMSELLETVVLCVECDLEVLTSKFKSLTSEVLQSHRIKSSFTSVLLPLLFHRLTEMAQKSSESTSSSSGSQMLSSVPIALGLPYALKLLDLFGKYSHLTVQWEGWEAFLSEKFQWVVHFTSHCIKHMLSHAPYFREPLKTSAAALSVLFKISSANFRQIESSHVNWTTSVWRALSAVTDKTDAAGMEGPTVRPAGGTSVDVLLELTHRHLVSYDATLGELFRVRVPFIHSEFWRLCGHSVGENQDLSCLYKRYDSLGGNASALKRVQLLLFCILMKDTDVKKDLIVNMTSDEPSRVAALEESLCGSDPTVVAQVMSKWLTSVHFAVSLLLLDAAKLSDISATLNDLLHCTSLHDFPTLFDNVALANEIKAVLAKDPSAGNAVDIAAFSEWLRKHFVSVSNQISRCSGDLQSTLETPVLTRVASLLSKRVKDSSTATEDESPYSYAVLVLSFVIVSHRLPSLVPSVPQLEHCAVVGFAKNANVVASIDILSRLVNGLSKGKTSPLLKFLAQCLRCGELDGKFFDWVRGNHQVLDHEYQVAPNLDENTSAFRRRSAVFSESDVSAKWNYALLNLNNSIASVIQSSPTDSGGVRLPSLLRIQSVGAIAVRNHSFTTTSEVQTRGTRYSDFTASLVAIRTTSNDLLKITNQVNLNDQKFSDKCDWLTSANSAVISLQTCLNNLNLMFHMSLEKSATAAPTASVDFVSSLFRHLCGSMDPLQALLEYTTTKFHAHLTFCQASGLQYLCPGIKVLEETSPVIVSSVFAPHSNYTLGFWLFLPSIDTCTRLYCGADSTVSEIHLISRVLETSDLNVVSLLSEQPSSASTAQPVTFSLKVCLVVDKPAASSATKSSGPESHSPSWHLQVSVSVVDYTSGNKTTMNASLAAKNKATRVIRVQTDQLSFGKWNNCICEIGQCIQSVSVGSSTKEPSVGESAKGTSPVEKVEKTQIHLYIDGTLRAKREEVGGRSPLHQNMIIGKIPSRLDNIKHYSERERHFQDCSNIYHNNIERESNLDQILLADVFWIPTTVFLPSAHDPLKDQLGLVVSSKDVSFSDRMIPLSYPSTFLYELLDSLYTAVFRQQESLSACVELLQQASPTECVSSLSPLLVKLCKYSLACVCMSNARVQETAVHTLRSVILLTSSCSSIPPDLLEVQRQAVMGCMQLIADCAVKNVASSTATVAIEQFPCSESVHRLWLQKLHYCRVSVERSLRVMDWGNKWTIDEGSLVLNVASVLTSGLKNSHLAIALMEALQHLSKKSGLTSIVGSLISAGGWMPSVSVNRIVDLCPRKLFLNDDPRSFEHTAFASHAMVLQSGSNGGSSGGRSGGVWLKLCDASFARNNDSSEDSKTAASASVAPINMILPVGFKTMLPSTEIVSAQDPFDSLTLSDISPLREGSVLKTAPQLVALLKQVVMLPVSKHRQVKEEVLKKTRSEEFEGVDDSHKEYLELLSIMTQLRCMLVQCTKLQRDAESSSSDGAVAAVNLQTLIGQLSSDFELIVSIAALDPVQNVISAFNAGAFKGVQIGVLRNLLKEGDVAFLEKIALRLWKQFRFNSIVEFNYGLTPNGWNNPINAVNLIQLASLAGEVVISDSKIRALSHFPSVRLLGVGLERCTGRWYYEVTLLSDGLMQIGWANSHFICDPICGQGVGDHNHSWAYDGLRTKKWNVSCEAYGRRWRLGDIVGALVDMDLMEMRFYLNGEDLGAAFDDFSHYELFPAFSLNVRQCVRLNFGQHKFLFPPDEIDGKAFRPILAALGPKVVPPLTALNAAPVSTSAKLNSAKIKSIMRQQSSDSVTSEGGDGEQPPAAVNNTLMRQLSRLRMAASSTSETSPTGPSTAAAPAASAPAASSVEGGTGTRPASSSAGALATNSSASTATEGTANNAAGDRSARSPRSGGAAAGSTTSPKSNNNEANDLPPSADSREFNGRYDYVGGEETDEVEIASPPRRRRLGAADNISVDSSEVDSVLTRTDNNETLEEVQARIRELQLANGDNDDDDEGNDESDEGENDDMDEEEDRNDLMDGRHRHDGTDGNDDDGDDEGEEDGEEESQNDTLIELRRQAMMESLLAMGFPMEWALRASEHCDATTSESAAISWIIEKMDIDQKEMEGDSSRVNDEEEFDENPDEGVEFYMSRHGYSSAASSSASGGAALAAERMTEMQSTNISNTNSPGREEIFGIRRTAAAVTGSIGLTSAGGLLSSINGEPSAVVASQRLTAARSRTNSLNHDLTGGNQHAVINDAGTVLFDGELAGSTAPGNNTPWNGNAPITDGCNYIPILVGQYTTKHRHDVDQQDVLSQVSELDPTDVLPIIASCEFALCIYYARALLLRSFQMNRPQTIPRPLKSLPSIATVVESSPVHSIVRFVLETKPEVLSDLFQIAFRQQSVLGSPQPDRLFPLICNGNVLGDCRDRVPQFAPFVSSSVLSLQSMLAKYEMLLFPNSVGHISVDDTSLQGISTMTRVLDVIVSASLVSPKLSVKLISRATEPAEAKSNNDANYSSISSGLSQLEASVLRGVGIDLSSHMPSSPEKASGQGTTPEQTKVEKFLTSCKSSLKVLCERALAQFDKACAAAAAAGFDEDGISASAINSSKLEEVDWIVLGLDRDEAGLNLEPGAEQEISTTPTVLWAYWLLRHVLCRALDDPTYSVAATSVSHTSGADPADALTLLTSAATISRLFKSLTSDSTRTLNLSLRYCVYDLCTLILALVNRSLENSSNEVDLNASVNSTTMLSNLAVMDYYVAIAKEPQLMNQFSKRIKVEIADKRLFSRYTKTLSRLLSQSHTLRRHLGFRNPLHLTMHQYHLMDFDRTPSVAPSAEADVKVSESSESASTFSASNQSPYLKIVQVSSNSITVSWSLGSIISGAAGSKKIENTAAAASAAASVVSTQSPATPAPVVWNVCVTAIPSLWSAVEGSDINPTTASSLLPAIVCSNIEPSGTFRADDLESDTLYEVTLVRDNGMLAHYVPVHGNDKKDESSVTPLLAKRSETVTADDEDFGAGSSDLDMLNFIAKLRAAEEDALNFPVLEAGILPAVVSSEEATNVKMLRNQIKTIDSMPMVPSKGPSPVGISPLYSMANSPMEGLLSKNPAAASAAMGEGQGNAAGAGGRHSSTSPVNAPEPPLITAFVATESEASFKFDSEHMSPNILVTNITGNGNSNQLTLRNHGCKKWSTARANIRMNAGVHRWDVHIDKCVSKNIFIGVASSEARLDNYVGCDKHGWAFLANKAVWHNKAKTKAYGELFRTGDTVSVILDLDLGTLSFILNHEKALGVAFENIKGPVYPTFSLYNEDDQLTVEHVRSSSGGNNSSGGQSASDKAQHQLGYGNCAAENVMERQSKLSTLLRFLTAPLAQDQKCEENVVLGNHKTPQFDEELSNELLHRWSLWKSGVFCRSFLVSGNHSANGSNEIVSLQISNAAIAAFTENRLHLHDLVIIDGNVVTKVVGLACHKVWFQVNGSGDLMGYTIDSITSLINSNSMNVLNDGILSALYLSSYQVRTNHIRLCSVSVPVEMPLTTSFEVSDSALREALNSNKWTLEHDLGLIDFMHVTAKRYDCDVFSLPVVLWSKLIYMLKETHSSEGNGSLWYQVHSTDSILLRVLVLSHMNDQLLPLLPLVVPFHLSDQEPKVDSEISYTLRQVRHLVYPIVKSEFSYRLTKSAVNGSMSQLLMPPRTTVLKPPPGPSRQDSFKSIDSTIPFASTSPALASELQNVTAHSLLSSSAPVTNSPAKLIPAQRSMGSHDIEMLLLQNQVPTTSMSLIPSSLLSGLNGRTGDVTPSLTNGKNPSSSSSTAVQLVLEIEDESLMAARAFDLLSSSASAAAGGDDVANGAMVTSASLQLQRDMRWQLILGYQCSLVGQLMKYLEQIACLNSLTAAASTTAKVPHFSNSNNAAAWEYTLRNKCNSNNIQLIWSTYDQLTPIDMEIPIHIRAANVTNIATESDSKSKHYPGSERCRRLFTLMQLSENVDQLNGEMSLEDDQSASGLKFVSEWQLFAVFIETACQQMLEFFTELFKSSDQFKFDAGEFSLILQMFHATGVMVGLSMRSGVPVYLPLPGIFYEALCSSGSSTSGAGEYSSTDFDMNNIKSIHSLMVVCAHCLRTGLVSVYPETALDLLNKAEVVQLFEGRVGYCSLTAGALYRSTVYADGLHSDDLHIQYFWASMYELSIHQLRNFLWHMMRNSQQSSSGSIVDTQMFEDVLMFGSRHNSSADCDKVSFRLVVMPSYDTELVAQSDSEIPADAIADLIPLTTYGQLKLTENPTSGTRLFEVGLRVPKYSCVRVALHHVLAFVNSVDN